MINGYICFLNIKTLLIKKNHKKLFRYIIEIWAQYEKQQDETFNRLSVVIPIIVYNGNTPCNFTNSIKQLFAILKEVKKYVPDFRKCILDLYFFCQIFIKSCRMVVKKKIKYRSMRDRSPSVHRRHFGGRVAVYCEAG